VAMGRSGQVMVGNVLGAAANVVANVALIPRLGLEGAAIATALAYSVTNLHRQFLLARAGLFHLPEWRVLLPGLLTTALATIPSPGTFLESIGLTLLLSAVFYGTVLLLGGLRRDDLELLDFLRGRGK